MTVLSKPRVESIDLLKGVAMVLMALDHARDYFHYSVFVFDPSDPTRSTLPIFFTRFVTHFCAPAFSFLAGTSAYLLGQRKSPHALSAFLVKRGLWLIFVEMTIINFAWYFDVHFYSLEASVIWVLGVSMIVLAALIHFPRSGILIFSGCLIVGHNVLDPVHFEGSLFWALLHEESLFVLSEARILYIYYPIIPWVAVMALGYYFGSFYEGTFGAVRRRKIFALFGTGALLGAGILRWADRYGEPRPLVHFRDPSQALMSFLNLTKYPPSLVYLLLTLGVMFMFLAFTDKAKGSVVNFFGTFGRVPFFYYILHLYVLHGVALLFAELSGFGWQAMIAPEWTTEPSPLTRYGFSLWVVYLVWMGVVLLLYPLCKWFDAYKRSHREKEWLSYL